MGSLRKFFSKSLVGIVTLALVAGAVTATPSKAQAQENATSEENPTKVLSFQLSYPENTYKVNVKVLAQGFDEAESISLVSGTELVEAKAYSSADTSFTITPPSTGTKTYKLSGGSVESEPFQVSAGVAGYQLIATPSSANFKAADNMPTITWTSNTSLQLQNNYYGVYAYHVDTGKIFYRTNGIATTSNVTIPRFYEDVIKEYGLVIAKRSTTVMDYSALAEIKAEVIVPLTRDPFTLTTAINKNTFKNFEAMPVITATFNQDINRSEKDWRAYLVNLTDGKIEKSGLTLSTGIVSFSPIVFDNAVTKTYSVVLAKTGGVIGASPSTLVDVRAESESHSISRPAWTITATISSGEFSSSDPTPVISVQANQQVNSGSNWVFYFVEEETGKILKSTVGGSGDLAKSSFTIPRIIESDLKSYSVYIARKGAVEGANVSTLVEVQAVSNLVSTKHKDWTLEVSVENQTYTTAKQPKIIATTNQYANGTWRFYLQNVETGEIQYGGAKISTDGKQATWEIPKIEKGEIRNYRVYIAKYPGQFGDVLPFKEIRAASESITINHLPWDGTYEVTNQYFSTIDGWPRVGFAANQPVNWRGAWCWYLSDGSTGELLEDNWLYNRTSFSTPYFWDASTRYYKITLASCYNAVNNGPFKAWDLKSIQWASPAIEVKKKPWSVTLNGFTITANQQVGNGVSFVLVDESADKIVQTKGFNPGGTARSWTMNRPSDYTVGKVYRAYIASGGITGNSASTLRNIQAKSGASTVLNEAAGVFEVLSTIAGGSPLESCTTSCAGDPINTFTGEFYENNVDLSTTGVDDLIFERSYSTVKKDQDSVLGKGWTHNFEEKISAGSGASLDAAAELSVTLGNGSLAVFFKENSEYKAYSKVRASLTRDSASGDFTLFNKTTREVSIYNGTNGLLLSKVDANGNQITISRNADGRISEVANSNGKTLQFDYYSSGLLESVSDSNRTINYEYDSNDRLVAVNHPLNLTQGYSYDSSNRITEIAHLTGGSTANEYDSENRVINQTDPLGRQLKFEYTENDRIITDPKGNKKLEKYSQDGKLFSVTEDYLDQANKRTRSYTYSTTNQIATITHEDNTLEFFFYDNYGNLSKKVDAAGNSTLINSNDLGLPLAITMPNGSTLLFEYDDKGNPVKTTDAFGNATTFSYNPEGLQNKIKDALGNETQYAYTADDLLAQITKPNGAIEALSYNNSGDLLSAVNPLGGTSSQTPDVDGKPLTKTDNLGNDTIYSYDSSQKLIEQEFADGTKEEFEYDLVGNLKTFTNRNNEVYEYTYDELNQLVKVDYPGAKYEEYVYDSAGRRIQEINALGETTNFAYTKKGLLSSVESPSGLEVKYFYNGVSQLVKSINSANEVTEYAYNSMGKILSIKDPNGKVTTFEYDLAGQLIKQTYADGTFEIYEYDKLGRNVKFVDAAGKEAIYTFDSVGNLATSTESGVSKTYSYDLNGRVTLITNLADNSTVAFTYDANGNLTGESYNGVIEKEYSYDEVGRRTTVEEGAKSADYSYDSLGRLIEKVSGTDTISYSYDELSNLKKLTYPSGMEVSYEYDLANQLKKVKRGSDVIAEYLYDQDGRQTEVSTEAGDTEYSYDLAGRLLTKNNDVIDQTYAYDLAGHTVISSLEFSTPNGMVTKDKSFTFDNRYRLATVTRDDSSAAGATSGNYTFDGASNATQDFSGATHQMNPDSQLQKITKEALEKNFTYSPRGNLTQQLDLLSGATQESKTFNYDAADRLVEANRAANPPNAGNKTYDYSAEGLLEETETTRGTGTRTNEYIWDTSSSVPSLLEDTQGSTKTEYIYGNGSSPIASVSDGDVSYLHTDRQGSIIGASDDSGDLKFARTYTEYGQDETIFGESYNVPSLGYTGALKDNFTGNYYLVNRFYDPETTRFLNVDPLLSSTHSAYSYVGGNPLNYSDPLGLSAVGDFFASAGNEMLAPGVGTWIAQNLFQYTPDLCSTAAQWGGGIGFVASLVLPPGAGAYAKIGGKILSVAAKTTEKFRFNIKNAFDDGSKLDAGSIGGPQSLRTQKDVAAENRTKGRAFEIHEENKIAQSSNQKTFDATGKNRRVDIYDEGNKRIIELKNVKNIWTKSNRDQLRRDAEIVNNPKYPNVTSAEWRYNAKRDIEGLQKFTDLANSYGIKVIPVNDFG